MNSRVVSVRISPSNPDLAVVGIEGGFPSFTGSGASQYYPGGIFRTEEAGQNWTRVTIGPDDERNGFQNHAHDHRQLAATDHLSRQSQ